MFGLAGCPEFGFDPDVARNLSAALLAVAGLTLLGLAALDWAAYTGFSHSLLWR